MIKLFNQINKGSVDEAGWGLGEAIVSGQITPDAYVIDKTDWTLIYINVNEQKKRPF